MSVSGQAAEKADAITDLTTSERPLHDYVAEGYIINAVGRTEEHRAGPHAGSQTLN